MEKTWVLCCEFSSIGLY